MFRKNNDMRFLLICAVTALILSSCDNDNPDNPVILNSNHIEVTWSLSQDMLFILSPLDIYSIKSSDGSIAKATVKEDSIFISTHDFGNAVLDIADSNGNRTQIEVEVTGFNNGKAWEFPIQTVGIQGLDENIVESIIAKEILEDIEADSRYHIFSPAFTFTFDPEGDVVTSASSTINGWYTLKERTLTIEFKNSSGYHFPPTEFNIRLPAAEPGRIILDLDLTDRYREMFPDEESLKVTYILYGRCGQLIHKPEGPKDEWEWEQG